MSTVTIYGGPDDGRVVTLPNYRAGDMFLMAEAGVSPAMASEADLEPKPTSALLVRPRAYLIERRVMLLVEPDGEHPPLYVGWLGANYAKSRVHP